MNLLIKIQNNAFVIICYLLLLFGIVACHSPNCYNFGIFASIFLVFFLILTFLGFYLYCGGSESQSQCCLAKVANYTVYISFRTLCKLELYWWKVLLRSFMLCRHWHAMFWLPNTFLHFRFYLKYISICSIAAETKNALLALSEIDFYIYINYLIFYFIFDVQSFIYGVDWLVLTTYIFILSRLISKPCLSVLLPV